MTPEEVADYQAEVRRLRAELDELNQDGDDDAAEDA